MTVDPHALNLASCLPGPVPRARGQEPTWKAGVARTVITTQRGVWLAGYGSEAPPDGKLHDSRLKALTLENPQGGAWFW
jgi:hypothetical protein